MEYMKIIDINTELTFDEIRGIFSLYHETELHGIFDLFDSFCNDRVGLHVYDKINMVSGYYENGKRNNRGELQKAKTWFFLWENSKNHRIRLFILENPFFNIPVYAIALFLMLFSLYNITYLLCFMCWSILCVIMTIDCVQQAKEIQNIIINRILK